MNELQNRIEKIIKNVEILDKRAYFLISKDGKTKRKDMNFSIPAAVFLENNNDFEQILSSECNKVEREKFYKINRLSNIEIEKLVENFVKVTIKGELEFSKKYGKELALRDKEKFLQTLFELSLKDNIYFNKPLLALAMEKIILHLGWIDEIGYLVISYFTKQRFDLYMFENIEKYDYNILNEDETSYTKLEKLENLSILSYKKVLEKYEYRNKEIYIKILNKEISEFNSKKIENTSKPEEIKLKKAMIDGIFKKS